MEDQREALNWRAEQIRKRESRAWILAGFWLHQIAEQSRNPCGAMRIFCSAVERKD